MWVLERVSVVSSVTVVTHSIDNLWNQLSNFGDSFM